MNRRFACRRGESAWRRKLAVSVLAAALPLAPDAHSLQAQVSPEILQVLQQGGAWVALPIEDGVGSFESQPVPTLGIQLRGHLRIWEEHTGSWHVVMRDLARTADPVILERLMVPGERVDFDYQTGMLGQIQIDVQWSEARDTTLRVWVGTELTPGEPDALTSTDIYCRAAGRSRPLSVTRRRRSRSLQFLSPREDAELGREPAISRPPRAPTPRTREGSRRRPAVPRRHPAGPDLPSPEGPRSKPLPPPRLRHRPDHAA